jgi:hypothetical protein
MQSPNNGPVKVPHHHARHISEISGKKQPSSAQVSLIAETKHFDGNRFSSRHNLAVDAQSSAGSNTQSFASRPGRLSNKLSGKSNRHNSSNTKWQNVQIVKNDNTGKSELIIENVDSLHDNSTLLIKRGEFGAF